jgi:hypothetical protein
VPHCSSMRRAACAWLLLACLLWSPKPLYAQLDAQYLQIDPHMRTHAGQQYHYSYMGSKPAAAYIGLGAAAQAAFTEADHITGVLLDDAGVATAAITQVRHCHMLTCMHSSSMHFCPWHQPRQQPRQQCECDNIRPLLFTTCLS